MKKVLVSIITILLASTLIFGCKNKNSEASMPGAKEFAKGEAADTEGEYEDAFEWYYIAAQNGHPEAQFNVANMYDIGEGIDQSYEEAFYWYNKAAEAGFVKAQYNLALMYDFGDGINVDKMLALKWYTAAANQGFDKAQYNLAIMYQNGEYDDDGNVIVEPDAVKAAELYEKAAKQDHGGAAFNLALMYEDGEGVKSDISEALKWYKLSAKLGIDDAAFNIGVLYENGGITGSGDIATACAWYIVSGEEEAMDFCEETLTSIQKRKTEKVLNEIEKELEL